MSTILDDIIIHKKKEVELGKTSRSLKELENKLDAHRIRRSLVQNLVQPGTGIIAEFKRKSPSKGIFKGSSRTVEQVVNSYEQNGAVAVSVLTDPDFFGAQHDDIIIARSVLDIPILRKDFIVDKWQIAESALLGADVILLIASCLGVKETIELAGYAKSLGLETLLEIHSEEEAGHICDEVDMVGINNRNLQTFEVSLENSIRLLGKLPKEKLAIAESGISQPETIITLRREGFKGFLIGENFMKEVDPGKAFEKFVQELKSLGN